MKAPAKCIACNGLKEINDKKCPACEGTGFQLVDEREAKRRAIRDAKPLLPL
jgi:DnaJ-class molecular chaperone